MDTENEGSQATRLDAREEVERFGSGTQRSNLFCLFTLAIIIFLVLSNAGGDSMMSDGGDTFLDGHKKPNRLTDRRAQTDSVPAYTLNFSGQYTMKRLLAGDHRSNAKSSDRPSNIETQNVGTAKIVILTKRTLLGALRLSNLELSLKDAKNGSKSTIIFSGFDLPDASRFIYHGKMSPFDAIQNLRGSNAADAGNSASGTNSCDVSAVINFPNKAFYTPSLRTAPVYVRMDGDKDTTPTRYLETLQTIGDDSKKLVTRPECDPTSKNSCQPLGRIASELPVKIPSTADRKSYDLTGAVISESCGFRIALQATEINIADVSARIVKFCFAYNVKVLLEIRHFLSQMVESESTRTESRVSIEMLVMHLLTDCLESALLLVSGLASNFMLSSFAAMVVFKLILIGVELRFILVVWKSHVLSANSTLTFESIRRESLVILRRLMLCVMLALLLFLKFSIFSIFFFAMLYLMWTPQILIDIWKGQRRSLSVQFILGVSVCRMALPAYVLLVPSVVNVWDGDVVITFPGMPSKLTWRFITFAVFALLMLVQLVLMITQRHFGSRFFVPSRWLPDVYDYYRDATYTFKKPIKLKRRKRDELGNDDGTLSSDESDATIEWFPDCVICMSQILPTGKRRVVTPCDHFFHENCLRRWMDVKMECPTCRGTLPPFA